MLLVVVGSAITLIPQGTRLMGAEIAVVAVPMMAFTTWHQLAYRRRNPGDPLVWTVSRMACTAVATVPGAVAGLSLATGWGGGLTGWPPPRCSASSAPSTTPQVLLVEIVR